MGILKWIGYSVLAVLLIDVGSTARADSVTLELDRPFPRGYTGQKSPDVIALFQSDQPGDVRLTLTSPGLLPFSREFIKNLVFHLDAPPVSNNSQLSVDGQGLAHSYLTTELNPKVPSPDLLSLSLTPGFATRGRTVSLDIHGTGSFGHITAESFDVSGDEGLGFKFIAAGVIETTAPDHRRPRDRLIFAQRALGSLPAAPTPSATAGMFALLAVSAVLKSIPYFKALTEPDARV